MLRSAISLLVQHYIAACAGVARIKSQCRIGKPICGCRGLRRIMVLPKGLIARSILIGDSEEINLTSRTTDHAWVVPCWVKRIPCSAPAPSFSLTQFHACCPPKPCCRTAGNLPMQCSRWLFQHMVDVNLSYVLPLLPFPHFVVLPKPPSRHPSASSSSVMPNGRKMPCAKPSPAATERFFPCRF